MSRRLAEFDYFAFAKQSGAKLKFEEPIDFTFESDEKKIVTLPFFLPLASAASRGRFQKT